MTTTFGYSNERSKMYANTEASPLLLLPILYVNLYTPHTSSCLRLIWINTDVDPYYCGKYYDLSYSLGGYIDK